MKEETNKALAELGIIAESEPPDECESLRSVALITYAGMSALVSMADLKSGAYRLRFIEQTGVPLPKEHLPQKPEQVFTKNLIPSINLTERING